MDKPQKIKGYNDWNKINSKYYAPADDYMNKLDILRRTTNEMIDLLNNLAERVEALEINK